MPLLLRSLLRFALATAGALAVAVGAWLLVPPSPAVILVVVDCLGADRFTPETMPRTWAALADEGTRYEHALAQSSWTRSAVGSILTGRWPADHGLYRLKPAPDRLAEGVPTLAEAFRAGGYTTAAFAQQAQLDPAFGLAAGFDRYGFRDGDAASIDRRFLWWNLLHRHSRRFVYLHYVDIHKPYDPDPRFVPEGTPSATSLGLGDAESWAALMRAVNSGERTLTAGEWDTLEALHVAEIRELDEELGRLWRWLQLDGTSGKSWIVLTSDHGEAFGEHGWFTHGGMPYGELVRIPLVIRGPGGSDPAVGAGHPRQVDLAPTLLAMAGLPPLPGGAGVDLLAGAAPDRSFAEYFGEEHPLAGARRGGWSLLRGPEGDRLYDLARDPGETVDVAREHPEVAAELGAALDGLLGGTAAATQAGATEAGTLEGLRELGYLE